MTLAPRRWAADLLHHWFHTLRPADWFGPSCAVDEALRRRYLATWGALRTQPAASFLTDPGTARAAILLFDQVPRNVFRNDARAYASDDLAAKLCREVLSRGWDAGLPDSRRQFVVMPLMHSEAIADQLACVAYCATHLRGTLPFARSHYRAIARFGRFPHRNAVLGRHSTPQERRAIEEGLAW